MTASGRWRVVALLGLVAVLVATAGCLGALDDEPTEPTVEYVPQDAEALVSVDPSVATSDEVTTLLDGLEDTWVGNETDPSEVPDPDDALADFEDETDLAYSDLEHVLFFAEGIATDPESGPAGGAIVTADWEVDDFVEAIEAEEGAEYRSSEYAGEEVLYVPEEDPALGEPTAVGHLDEGVYAVGFEDVVTDALDVATGEADANDGPAVDALEAATDGAITVAMEPVDEDILDEFDPDNLPGDAPDDVPDEDGLPDEFDANQSELFEASAWSVFVEDGDVGFEFAQRLESGDAAEDYENLLDAAISLAEGQSDDDLSEQLDALDVDRQDETVTVAYRAPVDDLVAAIDAFEPPEGISDPGPGLEPPTTATMGFDHDAETNAVTVSHEGGDTLTADDVVVEVGLAGEAYCDGAEDWGSETVTAGDQCTTPTGSVQPGDMVSAIYVPDGQGTSFLGSTIVEPSDEL